MLQAMAVAVCLAGQGVNALDEHLEGSGHWRPRLEREATVSSETVRKTLILDILRHLQTNDDPPRSDMIDILCGNEIDMASENALTYAVFKNIPLTIKLVADESVKGRWMLLRNLAYSGKPEALPTMKRFAKSAILRLREESAMGLWFCGGDQAVKLIEPMLSDTSNRVRYRAVECIAKSDDPSVIPLMIRALKDPYLYIRLGAATRIGKFKTANVAQALVEMLRASNPVDRILSLYGLQALDDPSTYSAIERAKKDREAGVARKAGEVWAELTGKKPPN